MHELLRYIDDNMKEYEDKVARGGELSRSDVECIKDLAKTKMAILTNEAMENEVYDGYSRDGDMGGNYSNRGRMYYDGGYSGRYGRGRGSNAKRDSMGRYSRGGYSYDDAKDDMVKELRELMNDAPDEQTKKEFQRFIYKMETLYGR